MQSNYKPSHKRSHCLRAARIGSTIKGFVVGGLLASFPPNADEYLHPPSALKNWACFWR